MKSSKKPGKDNGGDMPEQSQARHPLDIGNSRQKSEWIGRKLRDFYDETLSEPVPDRFVELLRQLDEKVKKPK